jgi:transcriptional regulator with XRE-family HTH domain
MATVGQRIKSAQAQAGGMSVAQIASEKGRPARFSAKTIGRVIRGERALEPHEAEWLAKVLHVTPSYFFEDPPAPTIEGELALILREIKDQLGRQTEVLEEIRGHAKAAQKMLAEQKEVKAEADEILRLTREMIPGRSPEGQSETPPTPQPPADGETTPAASPRTPARP